MFDLNEAIENWKRSFRGKCSAEDLEELVTHLLDLFENLKASGLTEKEAFEQALVRMGAPEEVKREFSKIQTFTQIGAGIAMGVAVGSAIGNVGLGIALGLAIGAGMSSSSPRKRRKDAVE
ncbi:MAG: permease prefix domain 1-containing protein [Verrucomicrobiota bacterium]|nr:permease prefix domain 1-containing protein [Verrucomicrobiota bacterium]